MKSQSMDRSINPEPLQLPSKTHNFEAFGPKDPIIQGSWAILMLRVTTKPSQHPFQQRPKGSSDLEEEPLKEPL